VHVITAAAGPSDRVTRRTLGDGLVVHRVPVARDGVDWWASRADFAARSALVVEELARDGEIDIAEFPECEAPGLVHAIAQCADGPVIPTIAQLHTPTEVLSALGSGAYDHACEGLACAMAAERATVGLADSVYAPSRFIAEWAALWWRLDRMPMVVPYALAPNLGPPSPIRADGSPMVVYIGRLEPRKGVMVLAEAWNAVHARAPEAMLILAGADTTHAVTGGSVKRAMMRAMTPDAAARAIFAGPVPHGELGTIIDRAAVCVVPSLWENFPNVAMEAMSRGRPIVASDRGGMAEMLGDSGGGVVFRSGDPDHLAEALTGILAESGGVLDARGREAHRAITSVCDPFETTRARIAVYREAIGRASHRDRESRAHWLEVATDVLRATQRREWPTTTRPMPGFSPDLLRWVRPPRRPQPACTSVR
jgi:glycosyltransferase involved in cell wall biosynthesis